MEQKEGRKGHATPTSRSKNYRLAQLDTIHKNLVLHFWSFSLWTLEELPVVVLLHSLHTVVCPVVSNECTVVQYYRYGTYGTGM